MNGDNVITLKDLYEAQQREFTTLRTMLADHDKRTVLLSYRTKQLENKVDVIEPKVESLENTKVHVLKVAGYVAAVVGFAFFAIDFILQNSTAIARVMQ